MELPLLSLSSTDNLTYSAEVEAKLSSWRIRHLARPYRNVSVCLLCCIAVILRAFFVGERIMYLFWAYRIYGLYFANDFYLHHQCFLQALQVNFPRPLKDREISRYGNHQEEILRREAHFWYISVRIGSER